MSDVMSTAAFGFSPRCLLRRLSDISGAPSLELARDASDQFVREALHLGLQRRDRGVHAVERDDARNRDEKSDDGRHERGGNRRRDRREVGATFGSHLGERVENTPDGAEESEHRRERDDRRDDAHSVLDPYLLLVENVLARSAHELDLARRERGSSVSVRLASYEKRADVRSEELEKPLARLLVDALESRHDRGAALEVVLERVVARREVAREPARRAAEVPKLPPLADRDCEHHDGREKLHDDDSLSHEVGPEESVN